MIYGVLLTLVGLVLTYIQYLRSELEKHQNENAMLKSQAQQQEWQKEIDAAKTKVTETQKDFKDAEAEFRNMYGTDDGIPPSGGSGIPPKTS